MGFVFVLCLSILLTVATAEEKVNRGTYGIMTVESSSEKENLCIIYFPQFLPLPEEKSKADFHILQDESSLDLCMENHPRKVFSQKVVLLTRNNCSLAFQANVVQKQGGIGAVFITPGGKVSHIDVNSSLTPGVNLMVALLSENSVNRLREVKGIPTVCMYAPQDSRFDLSLLVIWVVSMLTVTIGCYWSGIVRYSLYSKEMNKLPETEIDHREGESTSTQQHAKHQMSEESSLNISPYAVAAFVVCMGATLLLLYFFFDYLVYFLIGLFVIVSINSVYICLYPAVTKFLPKCLTFCECHYLDSRLSFDYRHLLLLCISTGMSVAWVVTRKDPYSWVLQDILGVFFCINMLQTVRLPSLKICTLLLVLLFFYDIFFVFVTPFLTARGESVMEEVATGGQSQEMLPMVFRVPHFSFNGLKVCYQQFSLLGFGDILVPGLLISYCHGFDRIRRGRLIYFMLTLATYGFGLILTFIGLFVMAMAQPALLYLVPATLIPPIFLAWCRGELSVMWNGFKRTKSAGTSTETQDGASCTGNARDAELSPSAAAEQLTLCNSVISPQPSDEVKNATDQHDQLLR